MHHPWQRLRPGSRQQPLQDNVSQSHRLFLRMHGQPAVVQEMCCSCCRQAGVKPCLWYFARQKCTSLSHTCRCYLACCHCCCCFYSILPREEVMAGFVDKFTQFHNKFMATYTGQAGSQPSSNGDAKH